jgi:hypothetical protein
MSETPDAISRATSVRDRYLRSLDEAIAQREALDRTIADLKMRAEVAVEVCREILNGNAPPDSQTPEFSAMGKYASTTMTAAILDLLGATPGKSLAPSQMATTMAEHGFQTTSKNLQVMVRTACKRMANKRRPEIRQVRRHGRIEFEIPLHEHFASAA